MITIDLSNPHTLAERLLVGHLVRGYRGRVQLEGRGPLRLQGFTANVVNPVVIDGAGAELTDLTISMDGTGRLWRNARFENIYLPQGDITIDGGKEYVREGEYEAFYSFEFVKTTVERGKINLLGAVFEGEFRGGRVQADPGGLSTVIVHPPYASSLYFDSMTFYGGRALSEVGDSHWQNCRFIETPEEGLVLGNNISGSVSDCHFERTNMEEAGPALRIVNVAHVRNAYVIAGAKTTHGIDVYTPLRRGAVYGGLVQDDAVPLLKANGWRRVRCYQ